MDDVAAALSSALRRPVRYTRPGLLRFAARLRGRHVGWDAIAVMVAIYLPIRLGQHQPPTDDMRALLGRPPHTLTEFLDDSAWRWSAQAWT